MGTDFMETYKNKAHPGSGISMTALAMGERQRAQGKELITAICAAYDLTGRIIDATDPSPEFRKKFWSENWQGFGAMFVAIKLLRLDVRKAKHSMGLGIGNAVTSSVHNILYVPASMSKCGNHFHNFVGINAALLADMGYTGFHDILDDPYPYWKTVSDREQRTLYTRGLGREYLISSSMSFKPWATCRWAQPGIESLLDIVKKEHVNPNDIHEVTYHAHEKVTTYPYDNTRPLNPEDAYWSVPWAFGNAALGYDPGPAWYIEERFADVELQKFMKKIKIRTLPEAVEAFSEEPEKSVTLLRVAAGGRVFERRTEFCKGDPQKPMSHGELVDKFLRQTQGILADEKRDRIIDLTDRLEKMEDLSLLRDCLF
jgi:2-methylcitrate dehydratase PrpD